MDIFTSFTDKKVHMRRNAVTRVIVIPGLPRATTREIIFSQNFFLFFSFWFIFFTLEILFFQIENLFFHLPIYFFCSWFVFLLWQNFFFFIFKNPGSCGHGLFLSRGNPGHVRRVHLDVQRHLFHEVTREDRHLVTRVSPGYTVNPGYNRKAPFWGSNASVWLTFGDPGHSKNCKFKACSRV